ncbi:MAG: MraY family glycosyltransferase [Candidatus Shapirobacteria bacterium]|nr:MraY family glycosyltransferase [Candidatus Shapirobacteria bacterium]MDD5074093.1 MraY family glycosyltransferase [Candidatus Shapirobacteria bacterium]MDD5481427.1 MraY family glycosyltransferase [Candidatus Shapirobacteria bacterium]
MIYFWPPFLIACFLSFVFTRMTIFLAWKTSLIGIDDPKKHHHPKVVHQYPVPRGGGLPIFLAVFLTSLFFLVPDKHWWGIFFGALITLVVGLFDDKFNLNPYLRLFSNCLAALCVVGVGIGIAFVTNPFNGLVRLDQPQIIFDFLGQTRSIWVLSGLFGLLWIIWNMNIVGWSSGVDGQLPAFVFVAALVMAILGLRFSVDITQWPVVVLSAAVSGAYFGFLPWNFYPQKIMPGYSGKSLAGFFLGVLAILSGAKIATAILVLGVPTMDALIAILRRISKGQSPVWGDRGHLHHKFLDLGFSKRTIALFYFFSSLLLGLVALSMTSQQKFYAIVMVFVTLLAFSVWFKLFFEKRK